MSGLMRSRTLTSIPGNSQRLDGGAMFGNAPRPVWERWIAPDERGRIPLACRALLVREGERIVLFESGIGAFFAPKLKDRFGVVEDRHVLLDSLAAAGVAPEDVDVIVLSHLHFDHAGGMLSAWREGEERRLVFPRARVVVGAEAWQRARDPHPRDRASFVPALNALLESCGRLEVVSTATCDALGPGYRFFFSSGHTPGMLVTEIEMPDGPVAFAADLIPGRPWMHIPITMGYDRFPEQLIDEKKALLADLHPRGGRIFYTHDPVAAMSAIAVDERGRYFAADSRESIADLDR
jgi:glyoxylase-like metal-dependent hydrolase (beta-lactamase superfamily II)